MTDAPIVIFVFVQVGGLALLKAVGFVKDDANAKLELSLEALQANAALLEATLVKLEKGYEVYCK
ncbi:hypothetical protein M885DRAFT_569608 [Pelagophyceae sp. CCMP2097]|nr:hypothetical protein M885DRAFT_569608 [Pelagophyceae sp. CCMP2097]